MRVKVFLDQIIQGLIAVLMGLMVVNVTWQVFSRYVLGDPSSFTDELSRYMMIWLGLAGAAYVSGKNGHLAIDILPEKLKGRQLLYLQLFIHTMVIVFGFFVMIIGGGNLVYITQILQQKSATLQIPLSWIYGIVPISGALVVYYHLFHIVQLVKSKA
ncbi:TRAP transporter small permease [Algoriphagus confluentis]|uniref:TRAP transporter small permease n=1 Tax=Algoriphagus confluentis TaxID=1697556 RepID=A0ABQ6PL80_9BACT|nr:TRAP transporter small permease [Algoriphagus confluentis]